MGMSADSFKVVELEQRVTDLTIALTNCFNRVTEAIEEIEGDDYDEGMETLKALVADPYPPEKEPTE